MPYNRLREMDLTESEPRIRAVAQAWASTLAGDPAFDMEDLLQELRWRYWVYWNTHGEHPETNKVREWARDVMLANGYVRERTDDNSHGFYRRRPEVVSVADEDEIDAINYRRTSRYARPTFSAETEDE